jgi:hypothetical protein
MPMFCGLPDSTGERYFKRMANKQPPPRDVSISFTKISDDVIVPTWLIDRRNSREQDRLHPIKRNKIIWWGFVVLWLFLAIINRFDPIGLLISTGLVIPLAIGWYLLDLVPTYWLEFNSADGFVSHWKSPKKDKLLGHERLDNLIVKATRRYHSSGPKGQTSEYRYYIELHYKVTGKEKMFCKVFELFGDGEFLGAGFVADHLLAVSLNDRVETFLRAFVAGEPIPQAVKSTYTFTL